MAAITKNSSRRLDAKRVQARRDRGEPEHISAVVARMFSGPVEMIRGGEQLGGTPPRPDGRAAVGLGGATRTGDTQPGKS